MLQYIVLCSSFLRTLPVDKFNGGVDDERSYLPTSIASRSSSNVPPSHRNSGRFLYVAEVEEIRVSPVVSRKGYLNCLDDKTKGWVKHWVVSIFLNINLNDTLELLLNSLIGEGYQLSLIEIFKKRKN